MTTWGILIGPVIVAIIVAVIIVGCAIIALSSFLDGQHAARATEKSKADMLSATYRKTVLLCHQQGDSISAVIAELEKFPASAGVLDQNVVSDLYTAHGALQQLEHEGKI